ncbi:hypothetical protein SAY86_004585 [Trapa natans]|uniref:Cytochrome P450 n=1 Tax=Trapa natans TaxID=22666 RepID=A0AAN7RQJ4_TRANT|nr:hypothetical protein SAY86_004585 [Trapa natans]
MDRTIFALMAAIVVASAALFCHFFKYPRRLSGRPDHRLPPGPRGLPLVGYLPFLGPNLHEMFMNLASTYGPMYRISIGMRPYVIISSPSVAREVVRDNDIVFANRNPNMI